MGQYASTRLRCLFLAGDPLASPAPFPQAGRDVLQNGHTTVALAIAHLHFDEILHPERITDATLGEGVAVAMLRTIQLAG